MQFIALLEQFHFLTGILTQLGNLGIVNQQILIRENFQSRLYYLSQFNHFNGPYRTFYLSNKETGDRKDWFKNQRYF